MVFALFNVVWATLFLERWKRREAELSYRWGTLDTPAESLEEPRPQFRVRIVTGAGAHTHEKAALHKWFHSLLAAHVLRLTPKHLQSLVNRPLDFSKSLMLQQPHYIQ